VLGGSRIFVPGTLACHAPFCIRNPKARNPKARNPKARNPKARNPKARNPKARNPKAEIPEMTSSKRLLGAIVGVGVLALSAMSASAAIVCSGRVCWHTTQDYDFPRGARVIVHPDD
jgi:hypothetical protein